MTPLGLTSGLTIATIALNTFSAGTQDSLHLRVNRWLEVRSLSGQVSYLYGQITEPAKIGTRLQTVGEAIRTGDRAQTRLALDTGIGFVHLAEKTLLRLQQVRTTPDGGRITRLQVTGGQVRLQLRRFTNPSSRLELETPVGVSGVRGTEFGVSVQPSGKTGVATLTGSIVTSAQSQSVVVDAGYQSLVIAGEPPTPPMPITNDTRLVLRMLMQVDDRRVRIMGKVDAVNMLVVANAAQNTDRTGQFDILAPLPADRRIAATVITPLGKQQAYELHVP